MMCGWSSEQRDESRKDDTYRGVVSLQDGRVYERQWWQ